jgi:CelD/BcsL family acetyltransferase involved in cellulose biosynthesis
MTLPWVLIAAGSAGHLPQLRVIELTGALGRAVGHVACLESDVTMLGMALRLRETPGNRLAAYYNSLVAPEPCMGSLLAELASQAHGRCDVLQFPALEIGSLTDRALSAAAAAGGWRLVRYPSSRSPYLDVSGSWAQFLETKSQNFRYNLKRKRKGLEKAGKLEEHWHRAAADVPELIAAMHAIEEGSWKTHVGMSITGSERELAYHDLLLPWLASIGALEANVLRLDGQPIAYSLCIRWLGKLGQLKTSFAERVSNLSPGLVVTTGSIENAFASGASEYDFLGDVMPHKMHWTDKVRAHHNVFAFLPTLRGSLIGRAKRAIHALRNPGGPQTIGRSGWKS